MFMSFVPFIMTIVCVCVCVCVVGCQEDRTPQVDFSLMRPGAWVLVRYSTTQYESSDGVSWRRVQVLRSGHVSETSFGRRSTSLNGEGWWVSQPPSPHQKFFLKRRLIEVKESS